MVAGKTMAIPVLAVLLVPVSGYADDTAALQALLTGGATSFPAGHTYNISGSLTVTHSLNLNGDIINNTSTAGATLKLMAAGITLTNGTLNGTWTSTMANNTSGTSGVGIYAANISVTNIKINNFPNYGIVTGGNYSGLVITGNTITNVGYVGFYYDSEGASTGGVFSNNTIDRSQIPPASVHQLAVGIRGSQTSGALTTGWTISNNVIKMPSMPTDISAECMELKYMTNSTATNNTCIGGSISISNVRSTGLTISGNKLSGSELESIEFADCSTSASTGNTITVTAGDGILLDGAVGSNGIVLTNDIVSGATKACVHAYSGTQNLTITGCTLTTGTGSQAVNLQKSNMVKISNTAFNGNGAGSLAVMLDTCPGNLTINGGTISNFTKCVVAISNATSGLVTDYVTMSGVTVNGVPNALSTYVANGGAVGTHITVVNH